MSERYVITHEARVYIVYDTETGRAHVSNPATWDEQAIISSAPILAYQFWDEVNIIVPVCDILLRRNSNKLPAALSPMEKLEARVKELEMLLLAAYKQNTSDKLFSRD